MADNTYEIIIKNEGGASGKKNPVANNNDTSKSKNNAGMGAGAVESGSSAKEAVGVYFAFKRVVSPIVAQAAEYGISTVTMRTGRREEQQRQQFAYDTARRIYGLGESIAVGAAVGGLPGALVSVALTLANSALSIAYAQRRINLAENLDNVTLGMLNVRAGGAVATASGSR